MAHVNARAEKAIGRLARPATLPHTPFNQLRVL
jgi:hypothetical protein